MSGNGSFGLVGVMGWPIAQSRSPILHNYWIDKYKLNGRYVPLGVQPDRLADAVRGLRALGFRGCNVTMPHKQDIMAMLDSVDDTARRMGAVNCVIIGDDGKMSGTNNDGRGYYSSLIEVSPSFKPASGPIAILGAGGASRAVIVALLEEGATEIRLINRTFERAKSIADEFSGVVKALPWERRADAIDDVILLTNATNQGMTGKPPLEISLAKLPKSTLVSDLIYVPPETPFLKAARERGNVTVNGLGMLLHQARPAFKAWFGVMPDITPDLRATIQATFT
ncbi:MAG: Shikimate 5-dehydrogenase I alpha [Pseudolabrys sp.]|jgi:shikimate dehydrogenase|nr:Shikimate 5-dehydrogenase I alpha [Pseudolabrys sp.]